VTPQTRLSYMKAMGIPVWAARSCSMYEACLPAEPISEQIKHNHPQAPSASHILETLTADTPKPVKKPQTQAKLAPIIKHKSNVENLQWDSLQDTVSQCQYCDMHKYRSHAVFGSGNSDADWMIIGEAPDLEEDQQGKPFLGMAGTLLDNILAAIDLQRESVYLSNIIKCRPPNDRDPHIDEINNCIGYLYRQIEIIQPKVILAVGRIAAQQLLQVKQPLGRLRGQIHQLPKSKTPVVVTYHPRYLLRQPSEKPKVWEDIKLARSIVQQ